MDDDTAVSAQDEEEDESSLTARIDELEGKLVEMQILSEERLDQLMRCRADLDNLMKRSVREKEDTVKYASEKLVLHMQLLGVLFTEGLVPIEAVGKKFDPYRHEALFQVKKDDLEEDIVAEEIQKGYLFNSRVIRFSKVAVNKPLKAEGCK